MIINGIRKGATVLVPVVFVPLLGLIYFSPKTSIADIQVDSLHLSAKKTASRVSNTTPVFTIVNINTANLDELTTLPGIGPKKAGSILHFRKLRGPYKRVARFKTCQRYRQKNPYEA